jgi:hypothetical protein
MGIQYTLDGSRIVVKRCADNGGYAMTDDPDERKLEEAERRMHPARVGDLLEHIDWRLMYGEFGGLTSIKIALWTIVGLLALILWRFW